MYIFTEATGCLNGCYAFAYVYVSNSHLEVCLRCNASGVAGIK